jgi:hypothetical protein
MWLTKPNLAKNKNNKAKKTRQFSSPRLNSEGDYSWLGGFVVKALSLF